MKTYTGMMVDGNKIVYVRYPGGSKVVLPKHFKMKSEDKFDWGKDNPESLNTAFSILCNAFGNEFCDTVECLCFNQWTLDFYEEFNKEILGEFEDGFWKITQGEICDFIFDVYASLESYERHVKNREEEEKLVATS